MKLSVSRVTRCCHPRDADPSKCIRCKQKKLKCDRKQPCDRCIQANAPCATAERKSRVSHKAKDIRVIATLNHRIHHLEKALQATDPSLKYSAQSTRPDTVIPPPTSLSSHQKTGVEEVRSAFGAGSPNLSLSL